MTDWARKIFEGTAGNLSSLSSGQKAVAVTGTAVQMTGTSTPLKSGVLIKSLSSNNAARATIGLTGVTNTKDGTGNGHIIEPGESVTIQVSNANMIYINGTVGDVFSWIGN